MSKKWPPGEIERAIELYAEHGNYADVATALNTSFGNNRTWKAVKTKLTYSPDARIQNDSLQNELRSLQNKNEELASRNYDLKNQVTVLSHFSRKTTLNFTGKVIRFGVVSDNHYGSLFAVEDLPEHAYDVFVKEGIDTVFNPGDIVEGEFPRRPGHVYELKVHGCDAQAAYAIETYPYRKGIITHFINGNHDWTYFKIAGVNIGERIAEKRPDMDLLGTQEADINLENPYGKCIVRLFHPDDGSAYAISYKPQRLIESYEGGDKPHVLFIGNYHKAEYLNYRNIHCLQAGCTQKQTPWMKGKRIAAMQGFWIIELTVNEVGVVRFKQEWFHDFG